MNSDERDRFFDWIDQNMDGLQENLERECWLDENDPDRIAEANKQREELDNLGRSWQKFARERGIDPYPGIDRKGQEPDVDRRKGKGN